MAGDLGALRDAYDEAMATRQPLPALEALVNEIDLTLLSGDAYRHQAAYQDSAQPALLFVNALRGLRPTYERPRDWQDAQLDDAIAHLQKPVTRRRRLSQGLRPLLDKQFEQVLALPSPGRRTPPWHSATRCCASGPGRA